jgi:N-acetylglucosamine kinase-like BadF-type ATPase
MTARCVIGIDAGGSKTLGLLVDESGAVLQRARTGGSNPRSVGRDRAAENLRGALAPLLAGREIAAVCIGAAGIAREADEEFFRAAIEANVRPGTSILLRNDAQIVLRAGTKHRPAVAVIAGTGSLVYGERAGGQGVRAGGYGALVGDAGSSYAIGMAAVRHAAHVLDGVEPQDGLSQAVLEAIDARTVLELIDRVHRWPPDVGALASLAPLVGDAAQRGEAAAQHIVERESNALERQVAKVARSVRSETALPVVLSGGAFDAVPELIAAVEKGAEATGRSTIERAALEAAHGAALTALDVFAT